MTAAQDRAPGVREGSDLLRAALTRPAWALIRLPGDTELTVVAGARRDHERLADVALESGSPEDGRRFDRLLCVPYRQIRERGFEAHDDATPLVSIEAEIESRVPVAAVEAMADPEPIRTTGTPGFTLDDTAYADLVATVVRDEIGNGAGANLVIARDFVAELERWDARTALGAVTRLLRQERGAYWTYLVCTGDRYLVGASPERHVRMQSGEVSMNPISGTFRLRDPLRPDAAGAVPADALRSRLLAFLADEKEIFELFMVVDEELKMMCAICPDGGSITGPFLKPMSHLIHTEYLLHGRTPLDPRTVLRDSMFAATVTGSPIENACRLIARYEAAGRGYYGAMLALLGRDTNGIATLDAPIVLRTADVSTAGRLRVTAGATLVRDSDPLSEVAETHAKAAGILSAFGLAPAASTVIADVASALEDPAVTDRLARRNARLSTFWLTEQSAGQSSPLAGRRAVVLDGEDDFVTMLRHLLGSLGMASRSVGHRDYVDGALDDGDLAVVGPGPGDPRQHGDPKIATIRRAVDRLLERRQPFLAVCLGHQVLCGALGLDLSYKDIVFQGTQTEVEVLGRRETVGFYNTFVARETADRPLPPGVTVDADPDTGDIHVVRGSHFAGIQFHAESVLTPNGPTIVRDLLEGILR